MEENSKKCNDYIKKMLKLEKNLPKGGDNLSPPFG